MAVRGVHQVLAGAAPRDAITTHALASRALLRAQGLQSEIFADSIHVAPDLQGDVLPYERWPESARASDVAIMHFSISSPAFGHVASRCERPAIQYHNITPPELLWRFNPRLAIECQAGLSELRRFKALTRRASAVSAFNGREMERLGFPDVRVTGIFRRHAPMTRTTRSGAHPRPRILFVGRGAPNKAQHDLILAVCALRQAAIEVELRLAGSWGGNRAYLEYCRRLVQRLGLTNEVHILGSIPDAALDAEYEGADVFACLSDHEGFCVPLVEAMERGLPIVAFGAGAVPETVGRAATLITDKRPSTVAEAIIEVLRTGGSSSAEQREEALARHAPAAVAARLLAWVDEVSS